MRYVLAYRRCEEKRGLPYPLRGKKMTYNLSTHMGQATMVLSEYFGLRTACGMIDSLKEQGHQALRIDIIESEISTSIRLSVIKDYFTYVNGTEPTGK